MALFRRSTSPTDEPDPAPTPQAADGGPARKDRPTPSRREAEARRRQRVTRTLTPKEARRESNRQNREARMKAMAARESAPEKQLMRDYIDSRFSLGEFLLPTLLFVLLLSFLSAAVPNITTISIVVMYAFILAVFADGYLMWRKYKKLLAQRLPKISPKGKGLIFYGMNRCIQIRRLRVPPPRIKRGEAF